MQPVAGSYFRVVRITTRRKRCMCLEDAIDLGVRYPKFSARLLDFSGVTSDVNDGVRYVSLSLSLSLSLSSLSL